MVTLIKQLIARGHAYEAAGEVLFDTQSMADYGALSGRKLDEQLAGARVAVDAHKKNPADFVLWKQSSAKRAGLGKPVGQGTSGLAHRVLGDERGLSRRRLRHPWRRARSDLSRTMRTKSRSRAARTARRRWRITGCTTASCRSKARRCRSSLGNFVTISEVLADWPGEVLRLNMLKTHYRSPIDWTLKGLEESAKTLDDWYWVAADKAGERPLVP